MNVQDQQGDLNLIEEIHAGLLQLADNEESVELWLSAPHPALDGISPQELIDTGKGAVVLTLVKHMLAGAPA